MTASPTAVPTSVPKQADGGGNTALAALFAAATANSMHRQISSPTASTNRNKNNTKIHAAAAAAAMLASITTSPSSSPSKIQKNQGSTLNDKDSGNGAARLIENLLNGVSMQQVKQTVSSPTAKLSINGNTNGASGKRHRQSPVIAQLNPKALLNKKPASSTVTETVVDLIKLPALQTAKSSKVTCETEPIKSSELRSLQTWHDEDEQMLDESCYKELNDSGNINGWSADDMFRYNEMRHKVTSSYDEKTLGDKYTTPLSLNKSKTTIHMALKLAKEIEDKIELEGRITPESSDDDELFEAERTQRAQLKKKHQLDLRTLKAINSLSIHSQKGRSSKNIYLDHADPSGSSGGSSDGGSTSITNGHTKTNNRRSPFNLSHRNHVASGSRRASNKSSSQHSNSSTTPVTASLSSSPTLNDSISHHVIKMTNSSRNILRTCLT